jgi:hypothetical protein
MKKLTYVCSLIILFSLLLINCDNPIRDSNGPSQPLTLFNRVLYYDGYAPVVNEPVPEGMVRVENARYAKKIPADFISGLRSKLEMDVIVEAACDNYDRIGKVFISLINKNEPYNQSNIVSQIEIARFITPFMDKINRRMKYRINLKSIILPNYSKIVSIRINMISGWSLTYSGYPMPQTNKLPAVPEETMYSSEH